MTIVPDMRERVHVKGRRGLFIVVSIEEHMAHVMALEGAPRVIAVRLDEIELADRMDPRPHKDGQGSI